MPAPLHKNTIHNNKCREVYKEEPLDGKRSDTGGAVQTKCTNTIHNNKFQEVYKEEPLDVVLIHAFILKSLKLAKDEALEAFYRWIPVRQRTIKELQEMIAKLEEVHRRVNIASQAGSFAMSVGIPFAIVGWFSAVLGAAVSGPLAFLLGWGVSFAGGLTAHGANIAEGVISRNKLKGVKEAIAKDEAETKHLEDSIKKLDSEISNTMERICASTRCNGTASNSQTDNAEIMKYFQQVTGLEKPTFDSSGKNSMAVVENILRVNIRSVNVYTLLNNNNNELYCPEERDIPALINSYVLEKAEKLL